MESLPHLQDLFLTREREMQGDLQRVTSSSFLKSSPGVVIRTERALSARQGSSVHCCHTHGELTLCKSRAQGQPGGRGRLTPPPPRPVALSTWKEFDGFPLSMSSIQDIILLLFHL